jgi:5-hydroxyisourate hydrolase-like protein (transthyretin family)
MIKSEIKKYLRRAEILLDSEPDSINVSSSILRSFINEFKKLNRKKNKSKKIKQKVTDALLKEVNNALDFQHKKTNDYSLVIKHDDTISFNANEANEILDKIKLQTEYLSENEHYHCVIVMYKITS